MLQQEIKGVALCMDQDIPSLWFLLGEGFSPSNPTACRCPMPGQCHSWFRQGDVLVVPRSHPQPL